MTFYGNAIRCDVTLSVSKYVLTNKEQLYQSFWQSVKQRKFKAKEIAIASGMEGISPPPAIRHLPKSWVYYTA